MHEPCMISLKLHHVTLAGVGFDVYLTTGPNGQTIAGISAHDVASIFADGFHTLPMNVIITWLQSQNTPTSSLLQLHFSAIACVCGPIYCRCRLCS